MDISKEYDIKVDVEITLNWREPASSINEAMNRDSVQYMINLKARELELKVMDKING